MKACLAVSYSRQQKGVLPPDHVLTYGQKIQMQRKSVNNLYIIDNCSIKVLPKQRCNDFALNRSVWDMTTAIFTLLCSCG